MPASDIQECIRQVQQDGYCMPRGHFPINAFEACQTAWRPIADDHLAEHTDNPNRAPNRHFIPVPFRTPLYHPAFFNEDTFLAIAAGILGEKVIVDGFASDTPFKGSVHQHVYADLPELFPERLDFILPPHILVANWSFVDVTPENGPFQIAYGTHLLPNAEALSRIEKGEFPLTSLIMKVGDVMVRDPRCPHRGSLNLTDKPSVQTGFTLLRPWYFRHRHDRQTIANQALEFQEIEMKARPACFETVIAGAAVDPDWDLMLFFELEFGDGSATRLPDWRTDTPYNVVATN